MTTCVCKTFSSWEEIESLREAWRDLHQRCGKGLFAGYDWIRPWWDMLGKEKGIRFRLVTAWQEERLVGALALGIRRCCGLRVMEWAGADLYDYRDILAQSPDVARELWDCAWRSKGYDVASIRDVRTDSLSFPCLMAFAIRSRLRETLCINMKEGKAKEWQNILPGKQRRNFVRQRRRLEQAGSVRFDVSSTDHVPERSLSLLIEQKMAWCQRRNDWGVFAPANMQNILSQIAALAARQNQLFFGTLICGDAPIAYTMAFLDRGTLYSYAKTYDEKWADYSPGMQALVESIRWAAEHDVHNYDFMRGGEEHKLRFSNDTRELGSFLFSRSLLGRLGIKVYLFCRRFQKPDVLKEDDAQKNEQ